MKLAPENALWVLQPSFSGVVAFAELDFLLSSLPILDTPKELFDLAMAQVRAQKH